VAGVIAVPASGPYSASKHAQTAFSRAAAAELRGRGVRVHTIFPGFVETPGFPQRGRHRSSLLERVIAEPDAVARSIVRAVERGRREVFVPWWYRIPAAVGAVAPGLFVRALARARYQRATR
jgi:short-subunit dehydrogenase